MTDTRAARFELGWLVDHLDVKAVRLAEMLELRRQWSGPGVIGEVLDCGIAAALLAIGFTSYRGGDDTHWVTVTGPRDVQTEMFRDVMATAAREFYSIAKEELIDNEPDKCARDEQEQAVLAEALGGAGAKLYAGTFGPDDEDAEYWWQTLGYASLDEWLAAPPWWQREGYSSLAEADAAWNDDDDEEDE